jgi:uncharacterized protein (PEP-CTERM system associated)
MLQNRAVQHMIYCTCLVGSLGWFSPECEALISMDMEITPHASVHSVFDDNVTYVDQDPVSDYITDLLIGAHVKQTGKTFVWSLDSTLTYSHFRENTTLNNLSEQIKARVMKEITRQDCIVVRESFDHFEEPSSFQAAFGRANGRYSTNQNEISLQYQKRLSRQVAGNAQYSHSYFSYSREDLAQSNLHEIETSLEYALATNTTIGNVYQYKQQVFSTGATATVFGVSVQGRQYLSKQVYCDLYVGVDHITSYLGLQQIHPHYRLGAVHDLNKTTQGEVSFQKSASTTPYTQDVLDNWQVVTRIAKQLSKRTWGHLAAFYGNGRYLSSNIQEIIWGIHVKGSYDLSRQTTFNLNYQHQKKDTNVMAFGYIKNSLHIEITTHF